MKKEFSLSSFEQRLVTALLAVHIVLSVGGIRHTSLTWDEPSYIGVGRQLLETRNPEIVALQLHPPLSYYVNSLLLLPLKLEPDRFAEQRFIYREYIGLPLVFESGYAPALMMFLVRIPFVVLSSLLGVLVWKWSRKIHGPTAAVLATFFYCFSPMILANCGLATADLLLALTMTLALYAFHHYLQRPSRSSLTLTGVALGLALLSKFTGLILVPTFALLALVSRWTSEHGPGRVWHSRNLILDLVVIFGIACLMVWAGFGFQFGTPFMPEWLKPSAQKLIEEKPFWQAVDFLAGRGVRIPAYSYILGIYTQLAAAKSWKDNFLFGQISQTGWWYFYWAAFLIKTPLPFIICIAAGLGMRRSRDTLEAGERFLLVSMLPMIALFCMPTRINIGVRYILPLIPLLCILAGKVANTDSLKWKRALCVLCVWYLGSAVWIYPHYLAYFNELVGGPRNGYKYLVDSSLDWGQDLGGLADYLKGQGITDARVVYFGPPGVTKYYGFENADPRDCQPSPGVWAVSATYLQGLYQADRHCLDWLKKLRPKEVIGYSIFIYDIRQQAISDEVHPGMRASEQE